MRQGFGSWWPGLASRALGRHCHSRQKQTFRNQKKTSQHLQFESQKRSLTISVLPHSCSSDSMISTWDRSSTSVTGQPPSVISSGLISVPMPSRSWLTSTRTLLSPHFTATLLETTGCCSLNWTGGLFTGSAGGSGNFHLSCSPAGRIHFESSPSSCRDGEWPFPARTLVRVAATWGFCILAAHGGGLIPRRCASPTPLKASTNPSPSSCRKAIVVCRSTSAEPI